jgi:hypothetical protein
MSWSRFIFKSHKWLAVGVGLLTLFWFVSGVVMLLPVYVFDAPGPMDTTGPPGPGYKEIAVSIPQAIAAVEAGMGREIRVTGIEFRRIAGRLLYRVQTDGAGAHFVDAISGERYMIDEAVARELLRLANPKATGGEMTLVRKFDSDYRYGPLPAYRMTQADSQRTTYYVGMETGEVRATNTGGRWRGFIAGLHTLDFLRPVMNSVSHRLLLIGTSVVGTLMSMFGLAILWIQFVNWQARRRAS